MPDHRDNLIRVSESLLVGRGEGVGLLLDDQSVSRHHARVRQDGEGLVVEDLDSRLGTFVNGLKVVKRRLATGDRVRFGLASCFRVDRDGLRPDSAPAGVALQASELCLSKGSKMLVEGASFSLPADSFVGIIGPSGSGKSTVLNCLAGFLKPVAGQLQCDGSPAFDDLTYYRQQLAYVPQDDAFHAHLTIRELLNFAARLRAGPSADEQELRQRQSEVLTTLGLLEHADKSQISGGQRKRLGIAMEFVRQPRLLLLDEPSSPLDPAGEADLMASLKKLTRQGVTVVCTTHKMDNLRLFDVVLVLGVQRQAISTSTQETGVLAYAGPPEQLLSQFDCTSYADLFDRLKSGAIDRPSEQSVRPRATAVDTATPRMSASAFVAPLRSSATRGANASVRNWNWAAWQSSQPAGHQLRLLLARSRRMLVCDRQLLITLVSQPVILGGLVAFTQFASGRATTVLFFAAVVAIWLGLNNSVRELVHERAIFVRERLAGLAIEPYLASKLVFYSGVGLVQLVLLLTVLALASAVWFAPQTASKVGAVTAFSYLPVLMLAYLGGLGLGLTISALARSEAAAIATLPILIMPQMLISVVSIGIANEPDYQRRAFRPLAAMLFGERSHDTVGWWLADTASLPLLSRPATVLLEWPAMQEFQRSALVFDLLHLLLLVIGCWVAAYIAVLRREPAWATEVKFA